MLILLPPSEGKNQPAGKTKLNLSKLTFADHLLDVRTRLVTKSLAAAVAAKAIDVYSGVLYQALDWGSLSATAKARGEKSLLIVSAIFGVLRPSDVIPNYKAKIKGAITQLSPRMLMISTVTMMIWFLSSLSGSGKKTRQRLDFRGWLLFSYIADHHHPNHQHKHQKQY